MMEATKRPWVYKCEGSNDEILGPNNETVCDWDHRGRSDQPNEADAELIVRAVNAHDNLVAACGVAFQELKSLQAELAPVCPMVIEKLEAALDAAEATT